MVATGMGMFILSPCVPRAEYAGRRRVGTLYRLVARLARGFSCLPKRLRLDTFSGLKISNSMAQTTSDDKNFMHTASIQQGCDLAQSPKQPSPSLAGRWPRTVYVALWFPLASETFVFYEVEGLHHKGLPVSVISLYNLRKKNLTERMLNANAPVQRLGFAGLPRVLSATLRRIFREPARSLGILRTVLFRRWRDYEMFFENAWAGLCGFYLAEECKKQGVEHLHAAWANGPATAAWCVHQLEGIPYSFTARAGDVRPPDGFLAEKLADCAFARADSSFNIPHLASFLPAESQHKLHLVYNAVTLPARCQAQMPMRSPCRVLAIGRLVETKGFQFLIDAVRLLRDENIEVKVTIAGSGRWMSHLRRRIADNGLDASIEMRGFVPHDQIAALILESDMLVMPCIVNTDTQDSDGLPTVIVEAMCHGLPVVSTDVASVSDVVVDGETGCLVPQRDARSLADAMRRLMDDRESAQRMAANARERVMRMFSPEDNLSQMLRLFTRYTPTGRS